MQQYAVHIYTTDLKSFKPRQTRRVKAGNQNISPIKFLLSIKKLNNIWSPNLHTFCAKATEKPIPNRETGIKHVNSPFYDECP